MHTSQTKSINQKRSIKFIKQNTFLESIDTIVIVEATTTSITLSITGIGSIIFPKSSGIACTLSLGNKVLHKIIKNKYNEYKNQYEKDQESNIFFDKIFMKTSQDKVIV